MVLSCWDFEVKIEIRTLKPSLLKKTLLPRKTFSCCMLQVDTAGDDRVLPAEQNDDITDDYYVSSNDVCVASPQIRDAALALMSLHSPPQGKKY